MPSTRRNEAVRKAAAVTVVVLLVSAVALAVALAPEPPAGPRWAAAGHDGPTRGGTLVVHHESDIRGLDPQRAFDELSFMAIRLLFDGLLDYDDEGRLVPSLAEALPEQSDDGRTFRFTLRRGIRFHNGRELVADDVRWSLEHMLRPETGSPGYSFYKKIAGVEELRQGSAEHIRGIRVLDARTFEITLTDPDQTFLNSMAMTFAYPVAREGYDAPHADAAQPPPGTGPFRLVEWERGYRLVFRRNDDYWRPGEPNIDRLVFLLNLARGIAAMRFRNGDIDHLHSLTPADYLFFKRSDAWHPYTVERATGDVYGIAMNCGMPPFDDVHLRRAVAFAIDREGWSRARANRLRPTGQPLPPGLLGYDEALSERQTSDLRRAREEMRLAGHPDGLEDEVDYWLGAGETGRFYGELAMQDLARIGIRLRLKQVSAATYFEETGKRGTAQSLLAGWSQDFPDPADFLDILFHTDSIHDRDSENRAFYSNPELDGLLDEARVEQDRDRRREMYERASNIVAHDAPWAFVFNSLRFEIWQPYVRNYQPNMVWANDYRRVWLDLPRRRLALRYGLRGPHGQLAALFPWRR